MKNINNISKTHKDKNGKVLKEPFSFLNWIFKVECVILIIFLLIGIVFNQIPNKAKFIIKYNIEQMAYYEINNKNYSYDIVVESIYNNNYLEEKEKDFVANCLRKEIEENYKYINFSKVVERLKTLKVNYNKKYYYDYENQKYKIKNPKISLLKIAGTYNSLFNEINIYEDISIDNLSNDHKKEEYTFEKVDKKIYFHELNHLLTKNSFNTTIRTLANSNDSITKNIFLETVNELFTREYFDEYLEIDNKSNTYEKYMAYIFALAEILPEEVLREYKFNENESILISGLLSIENNIEEAYKLIDSINSVSIDEQENYKKIHDGYEYFFEKKYNKEMSEDLIMLAYFYDTPIQTQEERDKIRNYLEMESYDKIIQIKPKGYISKDYKEKFSNVQIEYTKDGERKIIEIDK